MIVPTTLLVRQHMETFAERFAGFPVHLRALSRFQTDKESKETIAGLADGTVDVVIGTHRLLSQGIAFKDLGLVIIDEEQRFGVEHKDALKKLKTNVDILAMNEEEAEALTGEANPILASARALDFADLILCTAGATGLYLAGFTDDAVKRETRYPLLPGAIPEFNRYEFSRPMRRKRCETPIKVFAHIAPYHGGPERITSTNGAGDAALSALLALRAAHEAGVQVILLDRPNPIGGADTQIEGRTQSPGFLSFVGLEPVPIRHGLTVGEVLAHFAVREGLPLGRDGALTRVNLLARRIEQRVMQAGNSIGGAVSQDGTLVAAQNYQPGGIKVFDAKTLALVADIPALYDKPGAPGQRSRVVGLADLPGRRFVFSLFDADQIWIADLTDTAKPKLTKFENVGRQPYDALVTPDGRHYVVNGEKKWITGGLWADYFTVAVRTGEAGHGGLSLLVIDGGYGFGNNRIIPAGPLREPVRSAALRAQAAVLIGEDERPDSTPVRPRSEGGYGLTAKWADELHHAVHAHLTGDRHAYYEPYGDPELIGKELASGAPWKVVSLQNHDQVGNRPFADRLHQTTSIETVLTVLPLFLLGPSVPMLFQGEEWAASTPFPYFADHHGELAGAIREGRAREFAWVAAEDGPPSFPNGLPDATAESTYRSALLRWGEIAAPEHAAVLDRYRELIALRRSLPHVFGADAPCVIDQEGAVITMRRGGSAGDRGEGPGVATVVCDLDAPRVTITGV